MYQILPRYIRWRAYKGSELGRANPSMYKQPSIKNHCPLQNLYTRLANLALQNLPPFTRTRTHRENCFEFKNQNSHHLPCLRNTSVACPCRTEYMQPTPHNGDLDGPVVDGVFLDSPKYEPKYGEKDARVRRGAKFLFFGSRIFKRNNNF